MKQGRGPGDKGLGRRYAPDARDESHVAWKTPLRVEATDLRRRYWYMGGAWLNQGAKPHCVAYAWSHYLEDGPVLQPNLVADAPYADTLYHECQKADEWAGENYDGTSVRAGAKVLQSRGLLSEYLWAWDITTVKNMLLERGPVVIGTDWYHSMFDTDADGVIKVNESSGVAGGHATVLNGINIDREINGVKGFVRLKNSWGRYSFGSLGDGGYALISIADVAKLLGDAGEMCIATERKFAA